MNRGDMQRNYRGLFITVGLPLLATVIQWLLWPVIKPFSWFVYWPTVYFCVLYGTFKEGVLAILLSTIFAWWFFVPESLSWTKHNSLAYFSLVIFIAANVTASYFYNRLKKSRQLSEEKFYKASDTYHQLLDSLADGVFVAQDHKFVFCNAALPDMLGYTYLEFAGKPFSKVIVPYSLALWTSRFEQRVSGVIEPEKCYEIQFVHKNGQYIWVELRANLTKYNDRPAVLGIVRDITLRKKQQEKLHLADAVFQNTQEGIVVTDLQRNILATNPAFSSITEYSAEELLGSPIQLLQAEGKNDSALEEMQKSLDETGTWQGALWNRRKSGDIYREWLVVSTIRNEKGEPIQYIDINLDISRMKHVETHMEYLAQHDALTDLPNRLLLHSRLEHTLERAKRKNEQCAVMFLDLDRFKSINDTHGHAAGDEVLQIVSQRMKARIRDNDTLARLSGDEFVIILDAIQREDVAAVAKAIIDAIAVPCELSNGNVIHTAASIGISIFPDDGKPATWLLQLADQALYQSKRNGRGKWSFYNETNTPVQADLTL